MAKKIYVGNMSFSVTEEELRNMFTQHGEVTSVSVISDKQTGRSRGFGFVEMANDDQAQAAIAALNGKDISGRTIVVNEAKPREEGGRRGGGRGGFSGGRGRGGFGGGRGGFSGGRNDRPSRSFDD